MNNKNRPLSDLSYSYHELSCALAMAEKVGIIKTEYIDKVVDKFLEDAKTAIASMDSTFKKDQLLQGYYKARRVSFDLIKTDIYNAMKNVNKI